MHFYMDPRPVEQDSAPEVRRVVSRRAVAIVRSVALPAVDAGSSSAGGSSMEPSHEALPVPRATDSAECRQSVPPDRTLRNFVPRCGARSCAPDGGARLVIPRAPIGLPLEAAAAGAKPTPVQVLQRQKRVRLENSRVSKWLDMLARPRDSPRVKVSRVYQVRSSAGMTRTPQHPDAAQEAMPQGHPR